VEKHKGGTWPFPDVLVAFGSAQACSRFMSVLCVVFCLQILFFTVQYRNQPYDSTDINHAIHCCFPRLHVPGTSDYPAPEDSSSLPVLHYLEAKRTHQN
jgi:hypothetical protein